VPGQSEQQVALVSETRNARANASTTCTDGEVARPYSSRVS